MTTPPATMIASGIADQKPIVLCQLKSRALPRNPPLNQVTLRTAAHFQSAATRETVRSATMNRNARFDAPVIARPIGRLAPDAAT